MCLLSTEIKQIIYVHLKGKDNTFEAAEQVPYICSFRHPRTGRASKLTVLDIGEAAAYEYHGFRHRSGSGAHKWVTFRSE